MPKYKEENKKIKKLHGYAKDIMPLCRLGYLGLFSLTLSVVDCLCSTVNTWLEFPWGATVVALPPWTLLCFSLPRSPGEMILGFDGDSSSTRTTSLTLD